MVLARWTLAQCSPLPLPLAYHSVVKMKDRLYVMGGRTPQVICTLLYVS